MAATAQSFDDGLSAWKQWQDAPWGRLYYSTAQANISRHLEQLERRPLHILDVGGGNGPDAVYFAERGHRVTLLDFSAEMLVDARRAAEERGIADHIVFQHADCAAIPRLFPEPRFDLVLCHNVLQYVDDVSALLHAICTPLKPHGLLSLMGMNRYSETYRAVFRQGNLAAAYAQLDASDEVTPLFGATMRLYTPDEMTSALQALGSEVIGRYGVRCLSDYLPDDGRKDDPTFFAQIERLEHALAKTYPYYLLARYFQIIVRT